MTSEVTASLIQVDPNSIFQEGYELADQSIIPSKNIIASFTPFQDIVEFWIYDSNNVLIGGNPNFIDYSLQPTYVNLVNQSSATSIDGGSTSEVQLNPIKNSSDLGFDIGEINTVYNFIKYELSSSLDSKYYISEISSDRTEIRLKSNTISDEEIFSSYTVFKEIFDSFNYFDEFYINFDNNEYQIGVNIALDSTGGQYSILIKLYDALPPQYGVKDVVSVVSKTAESIAYQVQFPSLDNFISDATYLRGPNINLEIKDFVNNSTDLKSQSEILITPSTASKQNLQNVLNGKGIKITPNYSYNTFNEFVHFSSAKKRIENFVDKVTLIQTYQNDINTLNTITGATSESFQVSSSITSTSTKIENIIKNFDGYEYYLYYNSSSFSYPKTGSSFPYELLPTDDVEVLTWLGSDVENSQYYGGILLSASFYDNKNQDLLQYTIPEFIRENVDNNQYLEFINMVGQHFDEIWLYTKTITEKINTTSEAESGIPSGLAESVIASLGYSGFGNNYNSQDSYIGLIGENNKTYLPPTGSELITNYIAVNSGEIENYWSPNYSPEIDTTLAFPYSIDAVSKEIFKRLYHNMSYLAKKKGTISGLRQLINIWGIPNTILRINEFGGKNKDESDDYDLWYNRHSYAFSPISNQSLASASVVFPWMPLNRNFIAEGEYIVPDSLQFRFQTTGIPSSEFVTQSLAVKKSDGNGESVDFDFGIALYYESPTTGSYLGASSSEYENWGTMRFYISGSEADGGVAVSEDIYLPFFNRDWWSVMLQRNTHVNTETNTENTTYTLYVKNKTYNGFDGNSIGFEGSASIVSNILESVNESWNKFNTLSPDGIYLGGYILGARVGDITLNEEGKIFSGSLQEFRYYSSEISESIFNDFVMNPESIEGINVTGSLSSFDILNFRAPLGNEMENIFTSSLTELHTSSLTSLHPSIQGTANSLITGSFINPDGDITSSVYNVIYYANETTKTYSKINTEVYFLDQPAVGVRNRISNKIQIRDGSDYGNILSNQISIQQDYQISRSYTEDINNLEVAFSPQGEVNDDIIQTFGYGVVSEVLADPRFVSQSTDHYPQLKKIAEDYFKKYANGNIKDYLRLIKYFDNSIFKAIKNYVPARTSLSTGIVIKQHLLERNRAIPLRLSEGTQIATTPSGGFNNPIIFENLELTSSLDLSIATSYGGDGGSVEKFNYSGSPTFFQIPITQSWLNTFPTVVGLQTIVEDKQDEFYDGEYSGSELTVTTQSLFYNPYTSQDVTPIELNVTFSAISWPPTVEKVNSFFTQSFLGGFSELGEIDESSAIVLYSSSSTTSAIFVGVMINSTPIGRDTKYLNNTLSNPPSTIIVPIGSTKYELYFREFNNSFTQNQNNQFNFVLNFGYQPSFNPSSIISTPEYSNQLVNFNPFISPSNVGFENSIYFATPNNYNKNRENNFRYDLDYSLSATTAQNRLGVISGSATKAQTPNSNYTLRRSIIPRYLGSRLQSANYNFYTPSGSINPPSGSIPKGVLPYFLNGDSGSWGGDKSYGNTAVVNSNPIYIAQFEKGIQNPQVFDSITFTLESLIEIPREDITGTNFQPTTIKIEGNNEKLLDVVSTFDTKRKASYTFFLTGDGGANFNPSTVSSPILYSSTNPQFVGGTQFNKFITEGTMSFTENKLMAETTYLTIDDLRNITSSSTLPFMVTSSGALILKGSNRKITFTDSSIANGDVRYEGPGLCLLHSLNISSRDSQTNLIDPNAGFYPLEPPVAYPQNTTWDPLDPNNYFNFDIENSNMETYQDYELPFIIERGDEIRVSYEGQNSKYTQFQDLKTITFRVHGVEGGLPSDYGSGAVTVKFYSLGGLITLNLSSSLSDRILVTPDPSTLVDLIPSGSINSFTIIKRKDDETKVTLRYPQSTYTTASLGTPQRETPPGYLIPNDLSPVQKRNVNTVLNILRSQNANT